MSVSWQVFCFCHKAPIFSGVGVAQRFFFIQQIMLAIDYAFFFIYFFLLQPQVEGKKIIWFAHQHWLCFDEGIRQFSSLQLSVWMKNSFSKCYYILTTGGLPAIRNTMITAGGYSHRQWSHRKKNTGWLYWSQYSDFCTIGLPINGSHFSQSLMNWQNLDLSLAGLSLPNDLWKQSFFTKITVILLWELGCS